MSIDSLFNNNVSSNNKHQPKQRKNKSVFDKKDAKEIDNLDLKSTKELPQNEIGVTPSYQIIDGTTVHLNHNEPSIEPTLVKDIIQATVVPNEQSAVDKVLMNTKDKLESKEQIVEVDIKDFVKSSEKVLDLPDLIHSSPLNISAISDKIEYATENVKNESFTDEKDQLLNKVDTNDLQIPISDISKESNIKGEEVVELIKKDNINSNIETVENIDTKVHIQNIENTNQIKEPDILSSTNHIKSDLQNAKNSNEIEKDNQALKNVTNETKLEIQNAEIKDIQASEDDTIIATSDIEVDIQNMENSYKIEIKDSQSPESSIIATSNNITSNIQNVEKSNEFEVKDIQFSQNITISTVSDIKSDVENAENSPEIEIKDIQSSENVIITTNEIKSNVSNIENSDGIEINNNILENITINTENIQYFEDVIQSDTDQDNIKKEEESTSIENLNKYDNNQDLSSLFFTQNIKDKVSVIPSAENIETENIGQHKETISEIESNSKKIVLDIEDTMLKKASSDKYDLKNEDILSVTKETPENIFHEIEGIIQKSFIVL